MTATAIHFGSSGWRGIIADDFTFGDVRRAAAALAEDIRATKESPTLIVGYETRFFNECAQLRDLFEHVGRQFRPIRENLLVSPDVKGRVSARLRADFTEFVGAKLQRPTGRMD